MTNPKTPTKDPGYPEGSAAVRRLAQAADALWASLRERFPQEVADAQALIELDDSLRGMTVAYIPKTDMYDFVWTGRYVGSVAGAFIRGEVG